MGLLLLALAIASQQPSLTDHHGRYGDRGATGNSVFADAFESGDVSGWSGVVGQRSDEGDVPAEARYLGNFSEAETVVTSGLMDSTSDRDWFFLDVSDDQAFLMLEPYVELTTSSSTTDILYHLCVFYSYAGDRDITTYACTPHQCAVYDASDDEVRSGNCQADPTFDPATDLYGCCESDYGTDGFPGWIVRMTDVDGLGDQSGSTWIRVTTTYNSLGSDSYSLNIGD